MRDFTKDGVEWTTVHLNETGRKQEAQFTEYHWVEEECFLPDPASMMLDCPLRSGTSRDEPGMLTGSERTGWILHVYSMIKLLHSDI